MAGAGADRRPGRAMALAGALVGCAALVAACALGPTSPGSTAAEPSAGLRVLQMNLCDSGIARCYTGRSVAEAAALIRAERPDVITVNEVCRDDVAVLERALTEVGGGGAGAVVSAFQAARDRRTGADFRCRNGQPYGIGLVARPGTAPPGATPATAAGWSATTGGVYPMQDGGPEERAWLCLSPGPVARATLPPIDAVAACTTHLSNEDPAVARAQCAYLLGSAVPAVRARAGSVPLVLGGDLNLRSGGTPDVRSCVPVGDQRVDDGIVQHVVATPEFVVGSRQTIRMQATDHPGLLVTLTLGALPVAGPDDRSLAETG